MTNVPIQKSALPSNANAAGTAITSPASDRVRGLQETTLKLLAYCEANDWAGYDPYDALNSPIFRALPFLNTRWPRLVLTQALKRSPFNLRGLMGIPKTQNPKALALFLSSLLKISRFKPADGADPIRRMIELIVALRSADTKYWCWGYSFPWQTRTIVVPRGAPNLVCTTFVASALLDAYEQFGETRLLDIAKSAGEYLLNELYYTSGSDVASFSYPLRSLESKVHNANFLAAALLCRIFHYTGNEQFLEPALKAARYSASRQRNDGSWMYGELATQQWIDNFHTGFNLSALRTISSCLGIREFESHIRAGFQFYRQHFIREDGAARYFHDHTYPIDSHCVAQTLLTLLEFQDLNEANLDLAQSVFDWSMKHMWDEAGFFYYRKLPFVTIKTSYMRWTQAWMLLAMSTFAEHEFYQHSASAPPSRLSASAPL